MTTPELDERTAGMLATENREASNRIVRAITSAATHVVGALAGVPAATWAGSVTAGHVADGAVLVTSADAIAAAAAVGFGVVLLSSAVFAFVVAPLLGFLLESAAPPEQPPR